MTQFVDRLKRLQIRDKLEGFQCQCGFYTANPEIIAEHNKSRGKGKRYRHSHSFIGYVKNGINLYTKESVPTSKPGGSPNATDKPLDSPDLGISSR